MSEEEIVQTLRKNKFEDNLIEKLISNNKEISNKITLEIPL
ncbi:MAG: hypothetical protein ACOZBL_05495 [Patescibacteria group bacterium]